MNDRTLAALVGALTTLALAAMFLFGVCGLRWRDLRPARRRTLRDDVRNSHAPIGRGTVTEDDQGLVVSGILAEAARRQRREKGRPRRARPGAVPPRGPSGVAGDSGAERSAYDRYRAGEITRAEWAATLPDFTRPEPARRGEPVLTLPEEMQPALKPGVTHYFGGLRPGWTGTPPAAATRPSTVETYAAALADLGYEVARDEEGWVSFRSLSPEGTTPQRSQR